MFQASVEDQPYDLDRWGQYFKPSGYASTGNSGGSPAAVKAAPVEVDEDVEPQAVSSAPAAQPAVAAAEDPSKRAADIINMIRSRQKAS